MTNTQSIIVIKIGGTQGLDFAAICQDVAAYIRKGHRLVLIHGGSAEANALGTALGIPPQFITSPSGFTSRYTNRATLEIFTMAVNGKINTLLVEQLQILGINAIGLSGLDGRLIQATRKEAVQSVSGGKRKIIRDDNTGKINLVDGDLLYNLMERQLTPVIAPLAVGQSGEALNVDADRAAAMVAAALKASHLVFLTAVPGLLRKFPDESTTIHSLLAHELDQVLELAQGRMKKKVLGAQEALAGGVGKVIIADGRYSQPLSAALSGIGTVIHAG